MTLFILPLFLGPTELILILLVVLLLFGGRKIPELMRGLGRGVKAVSYTHLTLPTKLEV